MQKGHVLQFHCQACQKPVVFSIFDLDKEKSSVITCQNCNKKYSFGDETLKRQIKKFEALCRQIVDSEEILSHTSVGVDVGGHQVKIPYKLLLTRLNSHLELDMRGELVTISFRIEPLQEFSS